MMTSTRPTPPHSPRSSSPSGKRKHSMSLDFSDLPPLITPAPPSNTLLVTNLNAPEIFAQDTLSAVRNLINDHTENAIHTFSPLRSMRRIIITFHSIEAAKTIRSLLDGESLFNSRIRIYFGEPTPTEETDEAVEKRLLKAPRAQKQFFISPPPSPPVGWEIRDEDPPNKDVHAEDLANALQRLNAKGVPMAAYTAKSGLDTMYTPPSDVTATASEDESSRTASAASAVLDTRKRSSSVIVYDPQESGHSPDLPAIAVEDTTGDPDIISEDGLNVVSRTAMPRTEMPPADMNFGGSN